MNSGEVRRERSVREGGTVGSAGGVARAADGLAARPGMVSAAADASDPADAVKFTPRRAAAGGFSRGAVRAAR